MEGRGLDGNRPRFEEAAALLTQAADKHVTTEIYIPLIDNNYLLCYNTP